LIISWQQNIAMINLEFLAPYASVLLFVIIATGIAIAMVVLPFVISPKNPDKEKLSPYECGFEPTGDARSKFDIRFYLVGILFVIFDLEIAFLFPWALTLGKIGFLGYLSMMIFLFVLTIGFIYEWKKGALNWE
jgi:NADH-quinone oxidoreductase subunit A